VTILDNLASVFITTVGKSSFIHILYAVYFYVHIDHSSNIL
jgi:hypothetical protein